MGDIEILFDVCWILSPSQIQKLISQYHNADYEAPISPDILKAVAARVRPEDKNDQLLLQTEQDEVGPYQIPPPRDIAGLETCKSSQTYQTDVTQTYRRGLTSLSSGGSRHSSLRGRIRFLPLGVPCYAIYNRIGAHFMNINRTTSALASISVESARGRNQLDCLVRNVRAAYARPHRSSYRIAIVAKTSIVVVPRFTRR